MRPIKFRGKVRRTGKWYYGNLSVEDIYGRTHICTPKRGCFDIDPDTIGDIDPDTIGQFTGLKDEDGKEIYEGDIVKWKADNRLYAVVFKWGMFYASVEVCNQEIYGGFPLHGLTEYDDEGCEIVGNIYDNPELKKKGYDRKLRNKIQQAGS